MASKPIKAAFTGAHTAGIYADMTVDGPEIGTLVIVVDRAKNLPNRKTMGKQDPYCAARLGKEAKKTETDRRGGQTPRWDQELRFTVHDSIDYYQLKVSVFNDDRKTDLIGETWIQLNEVIIPGGGQNDLWHNLNCKGRYAGEIRIEATYYDTRPKEEHVAAKQKEDPSNGRDKQDGESLGGPRPLSSPKRRPLPANPTESPPARPPMPDHSQSAPLPYTPSRSHGLTSSPLQHIDQPSADIRQINRTVMEDQYQTQARVPREAQNLLHDSSGSIPLSQGEFYDPYEQADSGDGHSYYYRSNGLNRESINTQLTHQQQEQQYSQNIDLPDLPQYDSRPTRPVAQPLSNQHVYGHSYSSPGLSMPQQNSSQDFRQQHEYESRNQIVSGSSPPKMAVHGGSHSRHHSMDDNATAGRGLRQPTIGNDGPPPPVHRNSLSTSDSYTEEFDPSKVILVPTPLNIRTARNSTSGSPLYQVQNSHSQHGHSPISSQPFSCSGDSPSSYNYYGRPLQRQSQDPTSSSSIGDFGAGMPASLVPGYDPRIVESESDRVMREAQIKARHQDSMGSKPPSQRPTPYDVTRNSQSYFQEPSQSFTSVDDGQSHRVDLSKAPIIKPRAVSPNPRTPVRKSVSPQPSSAAEDRRQSGMPFSPDSYDSFNPKMTPSPTGAYRGKQPSRTPEQARETSHLSQQETRRDEGPIISSDGSVIDPSDHLPTDTWAPEPERKTPRKGPEVTVRFRQSPHGAQPMPPIKGRPLRDAVARPHSVSATPAYVQSTADVISSPSMPPASRVRLQKKPRNALAQSASSPVVPTVSMESPRSLPRTSASEYPLEDQENHEHRFSPTYSPNSPSGPPPVPAKVPFAMRQDGHDMDALSEEMRRIDIGVGGGSSGRIRRSRFGP